MYILPEDIGDTSPGSGCPLKGLVVASKAQPLHKQVIKNLTKRILLNLAVAGRLATCL